MLHKRMRNDVLGTWTHRLGSEDAVWKNNIPLDWLVGSDSTVNGPFIRMMNRSLSMQSL